MLKLGKGGMGGEEEVSHLCVCGRRSTNRDWRREEGPGNRASNHWLEKKFQEGIYLEKELVQARLGLDSILLRTGSYTEGF